MTSLIQESGLLTVPSGFHYGQDLNTVSATNGIFTNLTVGAFLTDTINPATVGAGVTVDKLNIKYDSATQVQSLTAAGPAANISVVISAKGTGSTTIARDIMQPLTSVTTIGATTATLWTLATTAGTSYDFTIYIGGTTGTDVLQYHLVGKAKNIGGVLTMLPGSTYGSRDPALVATAVTLTAVGTTVTLTVLGAAAQTITWSGEAVYRLF